MGFLAIFPLAISHSAAGRPSGPKLWPLAILCEDEQPQAPQVVPNRAIFKVAIKFFFRLHDSTRGRRFHTGSRVGPFRGQTQIIPE